MDDIEALILGSKPEAKPTKPASAITDDLLDRLRLTESGKDQFALNKQTKAMGPYQFMPETVQMLHKQGYKFNPFDETEAREMARTYLQTLTERNKGDVNKALAQYGGFVTKDPSQYVAKVTGQTKTQPITKQDQQPTDDIEALILGKTIPTVAGQTEQQRILQAAVPTLEQVRAPSERKVRSIGEYVAGAPGAALSLASQAVLSPIAAFKQAGEDVLARKEKRAPENVASKFMQQYGYQPGTEAGQEIVETVGKKLEATKIPPVFTPELLAAQGAAGMPKPKAPAPGEPKARLTYKEFERQKKIISGEDAVPSMPGLQSAGAAARRDPAAIQAMIDQLPPESQQLLQGIPRNKINPDVLAAHVESQTLPIPVPLTKGQATGDVVLLSKELNQRGQNQQLAYRFNEQNKALVDNIQSIRDKAAPDVFGTTPNQLGTTVIEGYKAIDKARNENITKLYGELEQAAGGNFPIDAQRFVNNADAALSKKLKSEFVPPAIERQLQAFRDGAPMNFEQFEALRTNIASEIRKAERSGDGNAKYALGVIRDSLEELPLSGEAAKLKPIADAARMAAKERFDALKRDPAYNAAVNDVVAPENFVNTFVFGKGKGTEKNVKTMMQALGKGTQEQQAVAAAVIDHLRSKSVDQSGNFSQAAFNKALGELDSKLLDIMDLDSVKNLKALGNVSKRILAQPRGSFINNSNTLVGQLAEYASKAGEQTANLILGGGYVPVGTMVKEFKAGKKVAKETATTLEPFAGVKKQTSIKDLIKGNQ